MAITFEQLIQHAGNLPPMPQVAQKVLQLIRNPETNASDMADAIKVDQVLTGMVLRWANSAYYGLANKVSTVQQAVVVLGMNNMQSLILSSSVAGFLSRPLPGYALERGELWRHSVGVATVARNICGTGARQSAEETYHAGLLCDIGKLAFEMVLQREGVGRLELHRGAFVDLERSLLGVDHAALGAEMARRWSLPEIIVNTIAFHHQPSESGSKAPTVYAVHLADAIVTMLGWGIGIDGLLYNIDPEALKVLRIDDRKMIELIDQASSQIKDLDQLMDFRDTSGAR